MNVQQKIFSPADTSFNEVSSTPKKKESASLAKLFDTFSTPKKSYRISTKRGIKNITNTLSASAKKIKHGLYRFKRESDGTKKIGCSEDLPTRFNKHLSTFRHPEKDAGKGPLQQAVQKNAQKAQAGEEKEDFTYGILLT